MGINLNSAHYHANRIKKAASALKAVRTDLMSSKNSINQSWTAKEMIYINRAFNDLNRELSSLAANLNALSNNIVSAAYQIKREEEAMKKKSQR